MVSNDTYAFAMFLVTGGVVWACSRMKAKCHGATSEPFRVAPSHVHVLHTSKIKLTGTTQGLHEKAQFTTLSLELLDFFLCVLFKKPGIPLHRLNITIDL